MKYAIALLFLGLTACQSTPVCPAPAPCPSVSPQPSVADIGYALKVASGGGNNSMTWAEIYNVLHTQFGGY